MAQKEHVTILKAKDEMSKPLEKATGGLNSLIKKINSANKPFNNLFKTVARFGKELGGVGTVANVIKGSFNKIISSCKEFEAEWANAEKATKRIDFAANINKSLGASSTELKNFAGNLADSIRNVFSQDEIQSAMGTLLFNKTGAQIKQILPVAADLATALGTDLNTAVTQLNNSFSGTVGQLGKLFPELKTFTTEELQAGKALEVIKNKVSGLSKEMANSTAGSLKNYKDTMANLREELGAMTTKVLTPMRDVVAQIAGNWVKALTAKRQYAEAEDAVNNGTADSLQYSRVLDKKYEEAAKIQNMLAERKAYKDLPAQYRGYVSEAQYNAAGDNLQNQLKDLNREITKLEIAYTEQGKKEDREANKKSDEVIAKEVIAGLWGAGDARKQSLSNAGYDYNVIQKLVADILKKQAEEAGKIAEEQASAELKESQRIADVYADLAVKHWEMQEEWSEALWKDFDKLVEEQRERERAEAEARKATLTNSVFGNMGQLGSVLSAFLTEGKIGGAIKAAETAIQAILVKVENISPIISAVFNLIDTAIDEFIAPLVSIFEYFAAGFLPVIKTIGQVIGVMLELLAPVFEVISKIGNVIQTVVLTVLVGIYNIITAIYNLFHKKDRAYMDLSVIKDLWSGTDAIAERYGYLPDTTAQTAATASASYTAARDIYVTINFNQSYVNGDAREIALNLRNEIRTAEALGY